MVLLRFDAPGQWAGAAWGAATAAAAFGGNRVLTMNKEMDKREKLMLFWGLLCARRSQKPWRMRRRSANAPIFHLSAAAAPSPTFVSLICVPARDGFKGTKTNVLCLTLLLIQAKKLMQIRRKNLCTLFLFII
jgi:hypothetical protein